LGYLKICFGTLRPSQIGKLTKSNWEIDQVKHHKPTSLQGKEALPFAARKGRFYLMLAMSSLAFFPLGLDFYSPILCCKLVLNHLGSL